ncbi:MAG: hypothetical protein ACXVYI_00240 [Mycobacterium sp.]
MLIDIGQIYCATHAICRFRDQTHEHFLLLPRAPEIRRLPTVTLLRLTVTFSNGLSRRPMRQNDFRRELQPNCPVVQQTPRDRSYHAEQAGVGLITARYCNNAINSGNCLQPILICNGARYAGRMGQGADRAQMAWLWLRSRRAPKPRGLRIARVAAAFCDI